MSESINGNQYDTLTSPPFLNLTKNSNAIKFSHRLKICQKFALDYILTIVLLIFLFVPLIVIALIIKFDSVGPVFFRQPRVGLNNEVFLIWKFRTMFVQNSDITGSQLTLRNDKRITRVGKWLRKTSLDELPQLFNVITGDMSLVGPRPHPIDAKVGDKLYKEVVDYYSVRHVVKPGITGWSQVNGWRGETITTEQIEQRVLHDLEYINRQSFLFDVWILCLTLRELRSKTAF